MKILFFSFLLLAFSVVSFGQSKVRFSGTIDLEGQSDQVTLTQISETEKEISNLALIDKQFEMEFSTENSELYLFEYGDDKTSFLVFHPGDELQILANSTGVEISGSRENVEHAFLRNKLDPWIIDYNELYAEYTDESDSEKLLEIEAKINEIILNYKSSIKEFISANKGSLLVLPYLEELEISEHFEVFKMVSDVLWEEYPNNYYVQNLKAKVDVAQKTAKGALAPEISLPNASGDIVSLSSLRGTVVLIDFWASWCGPCRRESPNMVKLYERYKDSGFEIFGVSLDTDHFKWQQAIADDHLSWTHVSDLKGWETVVQDDYGFDGIPFTVLIDKDGKIIAKGLRGEALEEKMKEIFGM
jgi:peroxiredoxin